MHTPVTHFRYFKRQITMLWTQGKWLLLLECRLGLRWSPEDSSMKKGGYLIHCFPRLFHRRVCCQIATGLIFSLLFCLFCFFFSCRVPGTSGFRRGERGSGDKSNARIWQRRCKSQNSSPAAAEAVKARPNALLLLRRIWDSVTSGYRVWVFLWRTSFLCSIVFFFLLWSLCAPFTTSGSPISQLRG